ncbi:hypothetical protein LBMAG27_23200 [Bacteroidota bacterium]|nr:hypothetical protein LBMAG27_23200 [Bacteroidota bacterium]
MKKHLHFFSLLIISFAFSYSEANATTQVVTVANFQFAPTNFTINLGDTVLFTWISGTHTTTSTTIPGGAVSWNHSMNSSSVSFVYVPAVSGIYNYNCAIHASMTGQFTVSSCVAPDYSNAIALNISACDSPFVMDATNSIATDYQWVFNSNLISGATNAIYAAMNAGAYSTIVSNSCGTDTTPSNNLSFIPKPIILIDASNDTICIGQSVILVASGGLTYTWSPTNVDPFSFGGDTATTTPSTSFEVTVIGTSFSGCTNTDSVFITVLSIPEAEFSFTQSGTTVTTNNTSSFATVYDWDFGDGFTTNNPTPSHTYVTIGVFTIQLIATNAEGCTDTFETVVDLTSGISESGNDPSISLSVNPASDKIYLTSNSKINLSSVKLYDISGIKINVNAEQIAVNSISVSTKSLSGGIYFVEVVSNENRFIQKVFVQ